MLVQLYDNIHLRICQQFKAIFSDPTRFNIGRKHTVVQTAQFSRRHFYTRISFSTKNPLYFFQNPYIMYLSEFLMKG